MGLFGKSFEEQVTAALEQVRKQGHVKSLSAKVDGKVVTLTGEATSAEAKTAAMSAFNALVQTENTLNLIKVDKPAPAPAAAPAAAPIAVAAAAAVAMGSTPAATTETIHEVVKGDTLSGLAKKYLGSASKYMEIFNANKDQLTNPDVIKVGQKLRIPR